jgi:hypothetical protein
MTGFGGKAYPSCGKCEVSMLVESRTEVSSNTVTTITGHDSCSSIGARHSTCKFEEGFRMYASSYVQPWTEVEPFQWLASDWSNNICFVSSRGSPRDGRDAPGHCCAPTGDCTVRKLDTVIHITSDDQFAPYGEDNCVRLEARSIGWVRSCGHMMLLHSSLPGGLGQSQF